MPLPLFLTRLLGDPVRRNMKRYQPLVDRVNGFELSMQSLSDESLQAQTQVFRQRLSEGASLDSLLPEVFAVVREASKRTLGFRHFDVQLIGGIVLHEGKIAEMKTGEGKTLTSTLTAYLNALTGQGVYIVTVNDYLARRDYEWMGKIFRFLGLTVGLIQSNMGSMDRIHAYQSDITYGTNNEFGFDYLRDHLAHDISHCCQRRRHFAIIDEVDSILIDEARTPLIISGPTQDSPAQYVSISQLAKKLQKDQDFTLDEKHKNVILTEEGIETLEEALGLESLYSIQNMDTAHIVLQCLKALHLYQKDVDYVVKNGEVLIVDEFTGRILDGRRYSDGLHQAIEAVEGLRVKEETQTLASITFQNYFRMFPKLAGMTGTAKTEETEFVNIYNLPVVLVPTHQPMVRQDLPDLVFKSKKEKYQAVVEKIRELHAKGQPVLVGTIAIETSELLSVMLNRMGVPHSVLNAKYHEKEAEIISQAGQKATVTIATNMAGRGTDIVLGENVKELDGLFVLGTERHESRRIDNQLRGRSGRQGDPGRSQFFVSLEDDLMRLFGSDRIAGLMTTLGVPEGMPIEHGLITKSLERAQSKVEKHHFSVRKQILQYDDVLNKQRETIYTLRDRILEKRDLDAYIREIISDIVTARLQEFFPKGYDPETDTLTEFLISLQTPFPAPLLETFRLSTPHGAITEELTEYLYAYYLNRKTQYPDGIFLELVKMILLRSLDLKWMDHLHNMDALREGIGLRAWGQRDPLIEYKMEAFDLFQDLLLHVGIEAIELIYKAEIVEAPPEAPVQPFLDEASYTISSADPTVADASDKVGRNDLCPCGSGKKYKKCCMK